MFYSSEILGVKSNSRLGVVWLAATLGPKSSTRKLGRRDLAAVDIPATCEYLVHPPQALSLRLTASMMIGVSRVYGQQCLFQYQDVQHFCARLTRIQTSTDLDMQPHQKTASAAAITMGKVDSLPAVSVLADLALPELDISAMLDLGTGYGTPEQGRKDRLLPGSSTSNSNPSSLARQPPFPSVAGSGSNHRFPSTDSSLLHSDLVGSVAFPSDDISEMDNEHIGLGLFQRSRPGMAGLPGMDVPLEIEPVTEQKKRSRPRKQRSHNLFDTELMLGKDELFLSESDITFVGCPASSFLPAKRDIYERVIETMLRPDGDLIEGLGNIQLPVHLELPAHLRKPKSEPAIPNNEAAFADFGDVEVMRGDGNETEGRFAALSTPSTKAMPWSSILGSDLGRRSSVSSSGNGLDSIYGYATELHFHPKNRTFPNPNLFMPVLGTCQDWLRDHRQAVFVLRCHSLSCPNALLQALPRPQATLSTFSHTSAATPSSPISLVAHSSNY
jgi:hypothetical protein